MKPRFPRDWQGGSGSGGFRRYHPGWNPSASPGVFFLEQTPITGRHPHPEVRTPMLRYGIPLILFALLAAPRPAAAQSGVGVGVIVGEPTGISFKSWMGATTAFDLGAAWSFVDEDAVHLHGDYLIHGYNILPHHRRLPVYYGLGARLKLQDRDRRVGVRFPLGVEYLFAPEPMDMFFEVVPVLDVAPLTEVNLNAAVGLRYFFR